MAAHVRFADLRAGNRDPVILFAPVNQQRKQVSATDPHGQRREVTPETREAYNLSHARSLCSLETQRTQSKESHKAWGKVGLSLRSPRLCVR
ncbi:MAG: hypothetical protein BA864_06680 [Desulfuromonadales bacterium C00003093]|nr:MAG: hypothetical protein BA864_06680 [Desulfuromonadales bacterium C00003093]